MSLKIKFLLIGGAVLLLPLFLVVAETASVADEKTCSAILENIDAECNKLGPEACKKTLEGCEKLYQAKSDQYKGEIGSIQTKKKTLQNQVAFFDSKIKSLTAQINKNSLIVKDLNLQIDDTQQSISKTTARINDVKSSLADLVQLQYENDQDSPLLIILTGEDFSSFFDNVMELEAVNDKTQQLLDEIQGLKTNLQDQQDSMTNEKDDLERVVALNALQKEENSKQQKEKQTVLQATKGQEVLYQKYLKESEAKASAIRKKIFELVQVSGNQTISLEQAYALALGVEKITGVRPAFLLGLLKQESAIGKNVGQCNCAGAAVCRNPNLHFSDINPGKAQLTAFKTITAELGMNIDAAPVSCYIDGGKVQFGGAMGPAQFMPSTWLDSGYKARVEQTLGVKPANPWRVKDAFTAAGLYLADNGAASQKQTSEMGAATAYLCGSRTMTAACARSGGKSYVAAIMKFATEFQNYVEQGILQN